MTDEETVERIEASLELDEDELQAELPEILAEVDGQTEELMRENPEVFAKVVGRMEEIDVAEFVNEAPEAADQFQELLWTGVQLMVENNEDIQDDIATDIVANFEATDCPMTGHLETDADAQTVRGGAGLVEDPDLTLTGPADTLVALITGGIDPVQGFMTQQYELDGSVQKGTQLASVMGSLTEQVPS